MTASVGRDEDVERTDRGGEVEEHQGQPWPTPLPSEGGIRG